MFCKTIMEFKQSKNTTQNSRGKLRTIQAQGLELFLRLEHWKLEMKRLLFLGCCYRSRRYRLCGSLLRLWSRSLWPWPLRQISPLRERRQRPSPMRRQEEEGGRAILRPRIRIRRLRIWRLRLRTSIRTGPRLRLQERLRPPR